MRCACIHDLAGLGHCSLAAALPILSVMGIEACPMPTAVLSSQTDGYANYSFLDMTPHLPAYIAHWRAEGVCFDGIYSGFLGSAAQLSLVAEFISSFRSPETLVLVDPVMGDDGIAYDTYTPAMCEGMRALAQTADVITPNLTEAALLLGRPWADAPRDADGLRLWVRELMEVAPRAVITGVPAGDAVLIAVCDRSETAILSRKRNAVSYPGSGDVFASVLLGALLRGEELVASAARAADFVSACIAHTAALGSPRREGLRFEPMLGELSVARGRRELRIEN